jgi:hypothetical protein
LTTPTCWLCCSISAVAATGDVNSDGVVDDADLLTVLFNFGRQLLR